MVGVRCLVASGGEHCAGMSTARRIGLDAAQEGGEGRPGVEEDPDVALRLGGGEGAAQQVGGSRPVGRGLGRQRQLHQDVDAGAVAAARLGCHEESSEQPGRSVSGGRGVSGLVLGQQHHREGDVFELVQIDEFVLDAKVVGACLR